MIKFAFNPKAASIIIPVRIEHKRGYRANLLFDTGASYTVITPRVAEEIGFTLSELTTTTLYTASGAEKVYELILPSVSMDGEKVENVEARCMKLPAELKIDGLLGLNFLRHFNVAIHFADGVVELEKIQRGSF